MVGTSRIAAVVLILAVLLAGWSTAAPTSQPEREGVSPESVEDQKIEYLLDHNLPNANLPEVQLSDAIDFIHDITGANIYVDWKAIELAGVTKSVRVEISANNIAVGDLLNEILKATGSDSLEFHVMQGLIVVSTKLNFTDRKSEIGPYLRELSDPTQAAKILDRRLPSVQLPEVSLSDALGFVRDVTGLVIDTKWQTLAAAGIDKNTEISLNLHDVRISTLFNLILDQAGNGELGYVTTPTQIMVRGVPMRAELVTISTIDGLEVGRAKPTTQPN
jgi:hypothetical protein